MMETESSRAQDTHSPRSITLSQTLSKIPTGRNNDVEEQSQTGVPLGSCVDQKEATPHVSDGTSPS